MKGPVALTVVLLALLLACSRKPEEPPLTASQKVSLGLGGDTAGTDEVAATSALRSIAVAQNTYLAANQSYACSLDALRNFLDPELASGAKSGYSFELSCDAGTYRAWATPAAGGKIFCTDQTGVVRSGLGSPENCFSGGSAR
jgi:hypothetical protein